MVDAVDRDRLLTQVAEVCRRALVEDPAARPLAQALGLTDDRVLDRYGVGYAGHAFYRALPASGGVRRALCALGLLDDQGAPTVAGCLLVPVPDVRGQVVGLAAVAADGSERLFPPDSPLHGLCARLPSACRVVTADTVLAVLRLGQAGATGLLALNPEAGEQDTAVLTHLRPTRVFVPRGADRLLAAVQVTDVPCWLVDLGPRADADDVRQALDLAVPASSPLGEGCAVRVLDDRVEFDCQGRRYELRDLDPADPDRLRVRLRAVSGDAFHLDTLDLYTAVTRTRFAGQAAGLLGCEAQAVERDLMLIVRKTEALREADRRQRVTVAAAHVMTPDDEQEARAYLSAPDLLDRMVADMTRLGYVGEDLNKRLGLLTVVSRRLDSPLSAVILSRAGAGKSRLMEVLTDMLPPEDLVWFTRLTPQALYYAAKGSLAHKVLMAAEGQGLEGAEYPLRELISSKKLSLATPFRDPESGAHRIERHEVEGPVSLLYSTTRPSIHFENQTRCFLLSLNETPEHTRQIHEAQRAARTTGGLGLRTERDDLRRIHRNVQRLLERFTVVNPYAPYLSFPTAPLEMRREHEKYLSLIDALALLHQHQRVRGVLEVDGRQVPYVEAAADDVRQANRLMTAVLGQLGDALSGPSRDLLDKIRALVRERSASAGLPPDALTFTRRDIRESTGWSDSQVKAHFAQLEELELVTWRRTGRGTERAYTLPAGRHDLRPAFALTDPADIRLPGQKSGEVGESLAADAASIVTVNQRQTRVEV